MNFSDCKNVLVIRPDNMGDLLMSSPAIRALKNVSNCKITVLCSAKAAPVAGMIAEIDASIVFDLPWLKFETPQKENLTDLIDRLKENSFDACVVFNVYSQNPAPCLMLAYLAEIPLRAAYSKENLYGLLTHWLPDDEPFFTIRHQVERDLNLAGFLGGEITNKQISIKEPSVAIQAQVMSDFELSPAGYFVLHAGVSEKKRQYPKSHWIEIGNMLYEKYHLPIVLTGSKEEKEFNDSLAKQIAGRVLNLAGKLDLAGLAAIIKQAKCMVSVNTGPMHLAVAFQKPLIALYAQSNPQHKPYHTLYSALEYSVPVTLQSSNQIIRFVNNKLYQQFIPYPSPQEVIDALDLVLREASYQ